MRDIILANMGKMVKMLAVITIMVIISLLAYEQLGLICGLFAGYLLGFAWYGIMLGRLWRSADMTVAQAKSTMAAGLILRLILLVVGFGAAIQISVEQFVAVVTGFAIIYVLGMVLLIQTNYSRYL